MQPQNWGKQTPARRLAIWISKLTSKRRNRFGSNEQDRTRRKQKIRKIENFEASPRKRETVNQEENRKTEPQTAPNHRLQITITPVSRLRTAKSIQFTDSGGFSGSMRFSFTTD